MVALETLFDLSEAETLFVTMCGMGAGLAAFFGEPLGGALFACEVLHRHGLEYYEAVIPTVIAGLACNWSFRVLADLPQEPIWTFPPEDHLRPWTSVLGLVYGVLGGVLGWAWMRMTNSIREKVSCRSSWAQACTQGADRRYHHRLIGILFCRRRSFGPNTRLRPSSASARLRCRTSARAWAFSASTPSQTPRS